MQEKQGIHRPDVFQTRVTNLVSRCFADLHAGMRGPITPIRSMLGSRCGGLSARKIGNRALWMAVFCVRLADLWQVQVYSSNIFWGHSGGVRRCMLGEP
jgi:hypothetical protein